MASADLTPRQTQAVARVTEMMTTAQAVHGDAFVAVVWSAVLARFAMTAFSTGPLDARTVVARQLMNAVRELASDLSLPPGQLGEALRHARVVYREGFGR